jgi:hypothetical protein
MKLLASNRSMSTFMTKPKHFVESFDIEVDEKIVDSINVDVHDKTKNFVESLPILKRERNQIDVDNEK